MKLEGNSAPRRIVRGSLVLILHLFFHPLHFFLISDSLAVSGDGSQRRRVFTASAYISSQATLASQYKELFRDERV